MKLVVNHLSSVHKDGICGGSVIVDFYNYGLLVHSESIKGKCTESKYVRDLPEIVFDSHFASLQSVSTTFDYEVIQN